jgi:hypothetical protein
MKKSRWRVLPLLYKLHRYLGLSSAIVLLALSVTGITLNHTQDLKLESQMISSTTILDWYGINAPTNLSSFNTQHHWLTQTHQQVFFDQIKLIKNKSLLIGAIETEDFIVAGFNQSLLLLSLQGELIEQSSVKNIEQLGIDSQNNIVTYSQGSTLYSDDSLLSWKTYDPLKKLVITWSTPSQPPKEIEDSIKSLSRSSILPLERVVLDLHSGRFFGTLGVFIVDLCGLFLILISLSGCAIWLNRQLRAAKKK